MSSQTSEATFIWKDDPSAGPIPAYAYFSTTPGPHPIALIFHAGGFVLGSTKMIPRCEIDYLVERGFVVITPEYRLCPQVTLYDGPVQDAKDVFAWCQTDLPQLLSSKGVEVDGKKIVSMGHSAGALLALTTGLCHNPPLAIVDFYGLKYLNDPSFFQPLAGFSQIPKQPEEFISRIYNGPQAITSAPMFVDGRPNLADPRCAWYIQQIASGTSLSHIVPDGDYQRVDATSQFGPGFPPTYILHGKSDEFVGYGVSVRANEELKNACVESVLVLPEVLNHAFDLQMDGTEDGFGEYVVPALEWLVSHV
ncbi:alpha beta-hydrolase [Phaeosphaeriaceae sp. PMI808]|nr:alpha beta-hydrolase [Phaeosphaeriaceae sp. PMI808]